MPNNDDTNNFQEAFDTFDKLYGDPSGTEPTYDDYLKVLNEDSSDGSSANNGDIDESQITDSTTTADDDDQPTDPFTGIPLNKAPETTVDSGTKQAEDFTVDYQKLYEQNKQNYESRISLLNSRLQNLSEQYQELKMAKTKAPEVDDPKSYSPKMKELFENYPDIADAVKELIDSKVAKTLQQVEHTVEERIQPIQSTVVQSEAQRHYMRIRSAHPDIDAIMDSGDLILWINSLPPMQKAGAQHIYQAGSADDIIDLLNNYKSARSGKTPKAKVNTTPANKTQLSEDEIVNKVLAAMTVRSGKEQINPTLTKPKREKSFDDAVTEWERSMSRR